MMNVRSDINETLGLGLFIGDFPFSKYVKYGPIALLPRAPPVALHKAQGRGIFMSGQDQNRTRAMSWTD